LRGGFEGFEGGGEGVFEGFVCIDVEAVVVVGDEFLEDFACAGEGVVCFEEISGIAAFSDSIESGVDIDIEEEEEVGFGGEGAIGCEDFLDICAAGSLIGCGRPEIAIENDDISFGKGGCDRAFHVVLAVEEEEFEFPFEGEAARFGGAAEFFAPFQAGWLFRDDASQPPLATPLRKEGGHGCLSGTIDSFDGNQEPTRNRSLHPPIATDSGVAEQDWIRSW